MRWLAVALAVAYPVLMHVAVVYDSQLLRIVALCCLTAAIVVVPRVRRLGAWLLSLAIVAGIIGLSKWDGARYAAYAPPIFVHALLMWVFARTLLPGREPLVTAISRSVRGSLSPELVMYTRGVTIMWSGCFAVLLALSVVLPFVTIYAWSLCTNVINYALIAALFVLEFVVRRWRFPADNVYGFLGYLRIVAKSNVRGF